jgi:hypothetical protein
MNGKRFLAYFLTVASLVMCGCGGGGGRPAYTRSVAVQWNDVALKAIRLTKPGPPMVARMMAIVHTCAFDAWAAYDPTAVGTRLGGQLRRPSAEATLTYKNKAISFAMYRACVDLFPSQTNLFNAQMAAQGYDPADISVDPTTPSGIGNRVAAEVIAFRHSDGSNQLGNLHVGAYSDYTGYAPVNDVDHINDPNHWQPQRFSNGNGGFVIPNYIGPHWGRVTPFALTSSSQFRPPPPAIAGSPEYLAQAQQILDYSANLTDDQKVLTEYWADGPNSELPPGHWCLFGDFISQQNNQDLDADVKMFFLVSNAVMDAGIACWECKRYYDYVRPITAIHYLFNGQTIRAWGGPGLGTISMSGENFGTYQQATFVTPPFPEYVSGHSSFSAAAAEVLKRFRGSDSFGYSVTIPAGSSKLEPGVVPAQAVTFTWTTFSDAADAAGISRRYGGIHFQDGDLNARHLGRQVGVAVWDKAQTYINGTAPHP